MRTPTRAPRQDGGAPRLLPAIDGPDDVRAALVIDRNDLGAELMRQASLMFEVGRKVTEALSARDGRKLEIDECASALRRQLRLGSDAKQSEAALNREVDDHLSTAKALRAHAAAVDAARAWENALDGVRARGYALHKLVDMELAQGVAIAEQAQVRRAAADERTQDALRRRRRGADGSDGAEG